MSSLFPAPPAYFRRYAASDSAAADDSKTQDDVSLKPPPPVSGKYTMFGTLLDSEHIQPTLQDFGIKQLYPSDPELDRKAELRKLIFSAVFSYMNLMDTLIAHPSQFESQIDMLKTIFLNVHHLLSEYRPHQARQSLQMLMEQQTADVHERIQQLHRCCEQVKEVCRDITQDPAYQPADADAVVAPRVSLVVEFYDQQGATSQREAEIQRQLDLL
ncbi:Mediator of RNA polymerase II transcription subunit 7 [Sorochytrium milnesiophthora]